MTPRSLVTFTYGLIRIKVTEMTHFGTLLFSGKISFLEFRF